MVKISVVEIFDKISGEPQGWTPIIEILGKRYGLLDENNNIELRSSKKEAHQIGVYWSKSPHISNSKELAA